MVHPNLGSKSSESKTLRNLLTDLQVNLLDDDDLAEAFSSRTSSVMNRLGAPNLPMKPSFALMMIDPSHATSGSGTNFSPSESIIDMCSQDLNEFIQKKSEGNVLKRGWYKMTCPFTEDDLQTILSMLHRYQTIFNTSIAIDILALTAATYNIVKESQQGVLYLKTREWQEERDAVPNLLSPLDFEAEHRDIFTKHKERTGEWLFTTKEFSKWRAGQGETLWCRGSGALLSPANKRNTY